MLRPDEELGRSFRHELGIDENASSSAWWRVTEERPRPGPLHRRRRGSRRVRCTDCHRGQGRRWSARRLSIVRSPRPVQARTGWCTAGRTSMTRVYNAFDVVVLTSEQCDCPLCPSGGTAVASRSSAIDVGGVAETSRRDGRATSCRQAMWSAMATKIVELTPIPRGGTTWACRPGMECVSRRDLAAAMIDSYVKLDGCRRSGRSAACHEPRAAGKPSIPDQQRRLYTRTDSFFLRGDSIDAANDRFEALYADRHLTDLYPRLDDLNSRSCVNGPLLRPATRCGHTLAYLRRSESLPGTRKAMLVVGCGSKPETIEPSSSQWVPVPGVEAVGFHRRGRAQLPGRPGRVSSPGTSEDLPVAGCQSGRRTPRERARARRLRRAHACRAFRVLVSNGIAYVARHQPPIAPQRRVPADGSFSSIRGPHSKSRMCSNTSTTTPGSRTTRRGPPCTGSHMPTSALRADAQAFTTSTPNSTCCGSPIRSLPGVV